MPDFTLDEIHDHWDEDDSGPDIWTSEEITEQIESIFDENREAVFRSKVKAWSHSHWIDAEDTAHRVGKEARELLNEGRFAPAVVWAATCAEIIFRELTLKPIFIGLFLGEEWADEAVRALLRGRWLSKDAREIAQAVLQTVAGLDVKSFKFNGHVVWEEVPKLIQRRNEIVHQGSTAEKAEAERAVDVVAGLYASILPTMRELCAVGEVAGYTPPEER